MRNSQSQSQKRNEGAASERNACPWRVGLSPRFIVPERPCMPSPPYTHSHTHHPLSLSYSPLRFISSLSHTHILSPFSVSLSRAKFLLSLFFRLINGGYSVGRRHSGVSLRRRPPPRRLRRPAGRSILGVQESRFRSRLQGLFHRQVTLLWLRQLRFSPRR